MNAIMPQRIGNAPEIKVASDEEYARLASRALARARAQHRRQQRMENLASAWRAFNRLFLLNGLLKPAPRREKYAQAEFADISDEDYQRLAQQAAKRMRGSLSTGTPQADSRSKSGSQAEGEAPELSNEEYARRAAELAKRLSRTDKEYQPRRPGALSLLFKPLSQKMSQRLEAKRHQAQSARLAAATTTVPDISDEEYLRLTERAAARQNEEISGRLLGLLPLRRKKTASDLSALDNITPEEYARRVAELNLKSARAEERRATAMALLFSPLGYGTAIVFALIACWMLNKSRADIQIRQKRAHLSAPGMQRTRAQNAADNNGL